MTPNFALSLSFDGIRLMHRVSGGWHLVGEAALDDPELTASLAHLRQTALALEPGGLRTKLLLPNDQIKYLSIDTTQTSVDDIHNALQGATPYAVDDLVIDYNRSGGRTHIAAVARETLTEAEAFATQHRFAPVTFAAVADAFTFNTEVFFGMTNAAPAIVGEDTVIERDDTPVAVVGHVKMPEPPAVPDAMPLTMAAPAEKPAAVEVPAEEPVVEVEDAAVVDDLEDTTPDLEDEPVLSFARSAWRAEPEEASLSSDEVETPAPQSLPEIEEPMFTSRQRATPDAAPAAPVVEAPLVTAPLPEDLPEEPLFTRRKDTPLTPGIADVSIAEPDAPAIPKPIIAPVAVPVIDDVPPAPAAMAATIAPAETTEKSGGALAAVGAFIAKRRAARKAKVAPPPPGIGTLGGKHAQQIGGKPKYLGLMLTGGLLLFLALVALWASTLSENGIAGLFGFGDDEALVAAAPVTVEETPVSVAPEVVEPIAAAPAAEPTTPIVTTVPGRVLSPGEADRIYAATGVWQRAPRLPGLPQEQTLEGVRTFSASQVVPPISQPRDLARTAQVIEAPFLAPPNPAPAGTIIPRDENGFILASASGTVMPNGVLVYARAPRISPPARPAPEAPVVEVAAGVEAAPVEEDPTADAIDATAATIAAALAADGQEVVTPEVGTQDTDEGLRLVAGRPDIVPPVRPETIEEAALTLGEQDATGEENAATDDIAIVADASLAGIRPNVRPDGLAPEAPFADPQLAGLRPSLRPADLAPPVVEDDAPDDDSVNEAVAEATASPDLNSVIATIAAAAPPSALVNPTRQAIVASPRPDTRPNNFSRVVASAQTRQQQADTQTTRASAPAVASNAAVRPTGSVPRSVASAATQESTINLSNVNLIGVYGRPNSRRALVRLSNGRYVKVEVGTSFQGGRITVIGDSALNYVVGGQTYSLQVPAS